MTEQTARRWCFHRRILRRCFLASTNSSALAVSTSQSASWNSRPASTRWRTCSIHSRGVRSTRRWPWDMKVRVQAGWPSPLAQWQEGLPQRVELRDREPGNRSWGKPKRRSRANLRCRQRAAGVQVLPRGVAAGEESGNFWWNVTEYPEAQEHAPGKYLLKRMEGLPADRITFVTCLIHEDNWYKQGTSWDGTYFEDRGRKQPRTPPYKPELRRMVRIPAQQEQDRIWKWWEELVDVAARDRRVRVMTAGDLLEMVRTDDLSRNFERAVVTTAARWLAEVRGALPEFVTVEADALLLGDCVQTLARALAGGRELKARTMLGPRIRNKSGVRGKWRRRK